MATKGKVHDFISQLPATCSDAQTLLDFANEISALTGAIDTLHNQGEGPQDRALHGARERVIHSAGSLKEKVGGIRDALNRQDILTGERKDALANLSKSLDFITHVLLSSLANSWGYRITDECAPPEVVKEWDGHWRTIRHTAINLKHWVEGMNGGYTESATDVVKPPNPSRSQLTSWPPEGYWLLYPWMKRQQQPIRLPQFGPTAFGSDPATTARPPTTEWIDALRRWLPDFDPSAPDWGAVKRLLLVHFDYKPADCERLSVADVAAMLNARQPPSQIRAGQAFEAETEATQDALPEQQESEDNEPQPPALTKGQRMTLAALAAFDPSRLASTSDVSEAMPAAERQSERTTREAIKKLVTLGLAERPEGEKQGARLTIKGRRLASKIAD